MEIYLRDIFHGENFFLPEIWVVIDVDFTVADLDVAFYVNA